MVMNLGWKSHLMVLIFFTILALLTYSPIISSKGVIGLRVDWPIPPFNSQLKIQISDLKYPIVEYFGLGELRLREFGTLISYILNVPVYLMNADGVLISRIHILVPLILSCVTMYFSAYKLMNVSLYSSIIAGIMYGFSPIFFNSSVNGFLKIMWAYPFLPLAFSLYKRLIDITLRENIERRKILINVLLISLITGITYSASHYILLILLLFIDYWIYAVYITYTFSSERSMKNLIKKAIYSFILTILTVSLGMLVQGNVLFLILLNIKRSYLLIKQCIISWNTFLSPELFLSFSMKGGGFTHFHKTAMRLSFWIVIRYLIIVFSFIALLSKKRNIQRDATFYSALLLILLILINRANEPFLWVNNILLKRAPWFFGIIRDVQYLTILVSLIYSTLIALSSDIVLQRMRRNKVRSITLSLLLLIAVLLNGPLVLHLGSRQHMTTYQLNSAYRQLISKISEDPDDCRIWLLPFPQPLQYDNIPYPFYGHDPLMVLPKCTIASYSTAPHVNVLLMALLSGWTRYIGHLESILNIKYNVFRFDFRTKIFRYWWPEFPRSKFWSNDNFLSALNAQADLKINPYLSSKETFIVYENTAFSPLIEIWNGYYIASGDLGLYIILGFLHEIKDEFKNIPPIIFACQFMDNCLLYEYLLNNSYGIIVYDNNILDLIIPLIHNKIIIDTSNFADSTYFVRGLMPMSMAWGIGLPYVLSLEPGVVTSTKKPINIEFFIDKSDYYNIALKVLVPLRSIAIENPVDVILDSKYVPKIVVESCGLTKYIIIRDIFLTRGKHKLTIVRSNSIPLIGITRVFVFKECDYKRAIEKFFGIVKNKNLFILMKFAIPYTSLIEEYYRASFGVVYMVNTSSILHLISRAFEDTFTAYVRLLEINRVFWISRSLHPEKLNEFLTIIRNNTVDFLVLESQKNKLVPTIIPQYFESRSPTNYIVHYKPINHSSFVVIFKNKWHYLWTLTTSIACKNYHFTVHGYANAWYVEMNDVEALSPEDEMTIAITNTLTMPYFLGLLFSIFFVLLSGIIILLSWLKKWI